MSMKLVAIALAGLGIAGQAAAADYATATVSAQSPARSVLVSHDGAFQPLLGSTGVVRNGDRVVALKSGGAALTYADGCKVSLKAGSMVTIGGVSPCAGAGTAFTPVQGGVFGTGVSTDVALGLGGLAVLIGVAAGLDSSTDRGVNNTPVSP